MSCMAVSSTLASLQCRELSSIERETVYSCEPLIVPVRAGREYRHNTGQLALLRIPPLLVVPICARHYSIAGNRYYPTGAIGGIRL